MQQHNDMTNVFVWSAEYETGLADVDEQHKGLVDLINRVGQVQDPAAAAPILDELAAYARDHFAMEQRLMKQAGLDERYMREHFALHANFVKHLDLMRVCLREAPEQLLPDLLRYLITWLADHILFEDQAMARQVHAIGRGMSAEAASALTSGQASLGHDALIDAMHRMFAGIAQRNAELRRANERLLERERELEKAQRDLAQLNDRLGARVTERTAEVYESQLRLQHEYDAQRQLVQQLEQACRGVHVRAGAANPDVVLEGARHELDGIATLLTESQLPGDAAARARMGVDRVRDALNLLQAAR